MNPPHPEPGLPRHHHHHLVHLHLDPRHHHHVHIHLCHHRNPHPHQLAPAPPAHLHHHAHSAPVFVPNAYPGAAPWQPEPPCSGEAAEDLDAELGSYAEDQAEDDDEEPVFVLTDEWAEFFAKSDAKRRLAKQQKNRGRK
ncbi:hypothetical protein PR202_ga08515 [Eleusine coracana subsp. coracana]|uniref:Uncharacterized protein n=1 Tax=Eleusine coracana subsp. coracana TaxID=191504 RepID=A0AAV5C1I5_ELECO|nr:hypothetical protein QOZ80_1BG0094380 [Eleusine coracana subsp. coracana]GJM92087.1 hypothetical protein PR202_ga08515 [Eleusine coracana subsp. coracana]